MNVRPLPSCTPSLYLHTPLLLPPCPAPCTSLCLPQSRRAPVLNICPRTSPSAFLKGLMSRYTTSALVHPALLSSKPHTPPLPALTPPVFFLTPRSALILSSRSGRWFRASLGTWCSINPNFSAGRARKRKSPFGSAAELQGAALRLLDQHQNLADLLLEVGTGQGCPRVSWPGWAVGEPSWKWVPLAVESVSQEHSVPWYVERKTNSVGGR